MATMSESEQELYQMIYSMTSADVRNELELHNLPTTGTKTACCQRLYKYKRQFVLRDEQKMKTPGPSRITTRQGARNQVKTNGKVSEPANVNEEATYAETKTISQADESSQVHMSVQDPEKSVLEDFQQRIEQNLEQKFESYMAYWGEKMSQMLVDKLPNLQQEESSTQVVHKASETPQSSSTPLIKTSKDLEVNQLQRKQKFLGTTIEVICEEISKLNSEETARTEMESALQRLKSWELEYSDVVQTIVSQLVEERLVNEEIQEWAQFQQKILQISSMAEKYISSQANLEESEKRQASSIEQRSSVASKL